MFIDRHREKLLNAILYFIANTRYCHTLKLFKLLNFLDFEVYRQTGQSVTGLNYKAWKQGPVPNELWGEITNGPKPDLQETIAIQKVKDDLTAELLRRDLKPRKKFDLKYFTKRELRVMECLAEVFCDVNAEDMSKVSHARRLPWSQVFKGGAGSGLPIPYDLAVTSDPLIGDMKGLGQDEIQARKELFAGTSDGG
ncbi:MAG: Panacea domain-containing protein [Rhizomicrobium sp.]|jgi:uncharacterized phage-associated protein